MPGTMYDKPSKGRCNKGMASDLRCTRMKGHVGAHDNPYFKAERKEMRAAKKKTIRHV